MAWIKEIAPHPGPLPASGERGRQALVASAFSPLAGRRWRQPDEGRASLTVRRLLLVLTLLFTPMHAFAVNPDEVLADPALEQRARALSAELRCMVCQNQSIDDSNAELARDLRVVVRERLVGGDTDEQVLDYVVSRYGEFVLLKPRLSIRTIGLWGAPAALAIIGLIVAVVYTRRRSVQPVAKLSAEEEARLGKLLERE
ncbi:cytochrome c-type biogenesis protein CcmH [Rhizobium rosettiformans]|uniref:Cytochrome c-type biogenesis protein n=2 Tax=Rhizobium rosettiformans TaxID=1368430 RepID=A0ABX7EWN4_9HYPH|nr:cytochrome c-type biogenesis protein CcmH [Rhizobium rosettiformans]